MTDIAHNPHRLSTRRVSLLVNGQEVNVSAEHPHLLAALRDEGLTAAQIRSALGF